MRRAVVAAVVLAVLAVPAVALAKRTVNASPSTVTRGYSFVLRGAGWSLRSACDREVVVSRRGTATGGHGYVIAHVRLRHDGAFSRRLRVDADEDAGRVPYDVTQYCKTVDGKLGTTRTVYVKFR